MKKDKKVAIAVFDIDGVIRDVTNSYRRALADTVAHFTQNAYRPTMDDIDTLKSEGIWNNDWEASQEFIYRYSESQGQSRNSFNLDYQKIVDFFQEKYRGNNYDGYIATEPLLLSKEYLANLTQNNIAWGFFSGATRASAEYVLKTRLELDHTILVAMEDAPAKPDPTGLFNAVTQLDAEIFNSDYETDSQIGIVSNQDVDHTPIIYVGDTVADIYTVNKAREQKPNLNWIAVGALPPHVLTCSDKKQNYANKLKSAGAKLVIDNIEQLDSKLIGQLI